MFNPSDVHEGDLLVYNSANNCCFSRGTEYRVESTGYGLAIKPDCFDLYSDWYPIGGSVVRGNGDAFEHKKVHGPW